MSNQSHPPGFYPVRRDRLLQERVHDSYQAKGKFHEPTYCPDCNAVFRAGRWQWLEHGNDAHPVTCPACHRERDHFPAGYVSLSGDFLAEHNQEILHLIKNREAREKAGHPLQRIMDIETTDDDGVQVTTTDSHLARSIGVALYHAYRGELAFHYNPVQTLLRVKWSR